MAILLAGVSDAVTTIRPTTRYSVRLEDAKVEVALRNRKRQPPPQTMYDLEDIRLTTTDHHNASGYLTSTSVRALPTIGTIHPPSYVNFVRDSLQNAGTAVDHPLARFLGLFPRRRNRIIAVGAEPNSCIALLTFALDINLGTAGKIPMEVMLRTINARLGGFSVQSIRIRTMDRSLLSGEWILLSMEEAGETAAWSLLAIIAVVLVTQSIAFFVLMPLFRRVPRRLLNRASKLATRILRVALNCLASVTASVIAGQDTVIGIKYGTVYGLTMLIPEMWDTLFVPKDEQGEPLPRASFWRDPRVWVDWVMRCAFLWVALFSMKASVPGYSYSLPGTLQLFALGVAGLGHVAFIADKFPSPDLPPPR